MKHLMKLTFVMALFAMVFSTSCKKYEEGPGLTLLSKKARFANEWKVDKFEDKNGNTETPDGTIELTTKKDGTLTYIAKDDLVDLNISGTWEFVNDKEDVKITLDFLGSSETTTSKIIQLKNKEMITEDENGIKTYYVAK